MDCKDFPKSIMVLDQVENGNNQFRNKQNFHVPQWEG
jgi:hypothetical protein